MLIVGVKGTGHRESMAHPEKYSFLSPLTTLRAKRGAQTATRAKFSLCALPKCFF